MNSDKCELKSINSHVLTDPEAAQYIGMSISFLRQSRMDGIRHNRIPGPNYIKIGRSVRYVKDDLDAWLNEHRVVIEKRG